MRFITSYLHHIDICTISSITLLYYVWPILIFHLWPILSPTSDIQVSTSLALLGAVIMHDGRDGSYIIIIRFTYISYSWGSAIILGFYCCGGSGRLHKARWARLSPGEPFWAPLMVLPKCCPMPGALPSPGPALPLSKIMCRALRSLVYWKGVGTLKTVNHPWR